MAAVIYPCVRYVASGQSRALWMSPREALSIELGEAAIQHALGIARDERGQDIRIEFYEAGTLGRCIMRLRVP